MRFETTPPKSTCVHACKLPYEYATTTPNLQIN